jgi:hypothetical protein
MAWMDSINEIITRYSGGVGGTASAPADPHQDFCSVAKTAPSQVTADGLAQAFRSEQTPSFPEMVSNLFRESNPTQQAGLLNRLMGSINPAALAGIPGLSQLAGAAGMGQGVTPEQASQVSPEQVQQAAIHAERSNPSVIDHVSSFYAQHPNVVKALGATALTVALQHISRRR